ncbi:MAG TPA: choice-of-anchor B family protein [Flavobacteriales bacterium]|nr:choice-of-anchor B family protein [Flavobacteriales bacterium]HIA10672.1 choice-of-anchor B family protein [Flavobacteriales bacterium]HIO73616.1 choice-of-anchor B family protein [Flavobacteriales bacterium]
MIRLVTLFVSLTLCGSIAAQNSLNISLLYNWMDTTIIPSTAYNNTYNEIWGVKLNNREYAIIGATDGTHFFDITNPLAVDTVAFVAGADDGTNIVHRDYHDYNGYLYAVCDEGPSTLQIIDLSFLPDSVMVVYDDDTLIDRSHNIFIDSASARLYNADGRIFSLADPVNPILIGNLGSYCHDMFIRNDTVFCNKGTDGLFIYDMSNISSSQLIGSLTIYPDQDYNHSGWLSDDGTVYVFADEKHGMDLKVCDVSNLANITVLSQINANSSDTSAIPHNLIIDGDFLFVSYYYDGLQIYNISNPANPVKVGYYDTYSLSNFKSYKGAWGVYPLLPSGLVLVSDMQTGLYVFDVSVALGVEEATFESSTSIYPNPAVDKLTIKSKETLSKNTLISVYDGLGKLLRQAVVPVSGLSELSIDVSGLSDGFYVIGITDSHQSIVHKIIKTSN